MKHEGLARGSLPPGDAHDPGLSALTLLIAWESDEINTNRYTFLYTKRNGPNKR